MFYVIVIGEGKDRVVIGSYDERKVALADLHIGKKRRMLVFPTAAARDTFIADRSSDVQRFECCSMKMGMLGAGRGAVSSKNQTKFRKFLTEGNTTKVVQLITTFPALLISGLNVPRKYGSANALQIAAECGHTDICQNILASVSNPAYIAAFQGGHNGMTYELSATLFELYLNSPNLYTYETPIHLAVKFGHVGVVKLLLSYPQCALKPNKSGQYPRDMICSQVEAPNRNQSVAEEIAAMLGENFFVPLIRTEGDVEQPYVGEPFSREALPDLSPATGSKFKFQRRITAFAGPMSLQKAQKFYKRWKNPPRLIVCMSIHNEAVDGKMY